MNLICIGILFNVIVNYFAVRTYNAYSNPALALFSLKISSVSFVLGKQNFIALYIQYISNFWQSKFQLWAMTQGSSYYKENQTAVFYQHYKISKCEKGVDLLLKLEDLYLSRVDGRNLLLKEHYIFHFYFCKAKLSMITNMPFFSHFFLL